jgi:hypothetical protein
MSEQTLRPGGLDARLIITIVIGLIALACIAGLAATVIVLAGEIPWHHLFTAGCG